MTPFIFLAISLPKTYDGNTLPNKFRSSSLISKNVWFSAIVAPYIFPPAAFIKTSILPYFSIILIDASCKLFLH